MTLNDSRGADGERAPVRRQSRFVDVVRAQTIALKVRGLAPTHWRAVIGEASARVWSAARARTRTD